MTTDEFCRRLTEDCAVAPDSLVLLAVSGGADSVALLCFFCEAAKRLPLSLACAHVEHGIRGEASLQDMEFVRALCREKGVPFYAGRVDAPAFAREKGMGLEEAARALRYAFLEETADRLRASVIATAHHLRDQAETALLHAIRGSDVRGLCAMRMRRGRLIRPLLGEEPEALRAYLRSIGQIWREDATNEDAQYARNRVRQRILPEMRIINPGVDAALCRLAASAQRDEDYFAEAISALHIRLHPIAHGGALPLQALRGLHEALLGRALMRACEAARVPEPDQASLRLIMEAIRGGRQTAVNLPEGAIARTGRETLCLLRKETPPAPVPLGASGATDTPFGRFEVEAALPGETGDGALAQVMPSRLIPGAFVEAKREGESIVRFGRRSPTPLKKLFSDEGVERGLRQSVPIMKDEGGVLWAVGLRPSERLRVSAGEGAVLVRYIPMPDIEL